MPAIGGFLGWNEPPPAATITALHSNTLPASVVRRKAGLSAVPIAVSPSTISPKWNVGWNGSICFIRLSTRPWPVTIGKAGMS